MTYNGEVSAISEPLLCSLPVERVYAFSAKSLLLTPHDLWPELMRIPVCAQDPLTTNVVERSRFEQRFCSLHMKRGGSSILHRAQVSVDPSASHFQHLVRKIIGACGGAGATVGLGFFP